MNKPKYNDPNFSKEQYWKNRKDNIRGQATPDEAKAIKQLRKIRSGVIDGKA